MKKAVFYFCCVYILTACGTGNVKEETITKVTSTAKYTYLCSEFIEHLNNGQPDFLIEKFDIDTLVRNILSGLKLAPKVREQLSTDFKRTLPEELFGQLETNFLVSEYWYTINVEDKRRCVVHSDLTEEGMIMIDFTMSDVSGTPKFIDWQDYIFNTRASTAMREVVKMYVNSNAKGNANALIIRDDLIAFTSAIKSGNVDQSILSFKSLRDGLQSNPIYIKQLLKVVPTDHESYQEIIELLIDVVADEDKGFIFFDYYAEAQDLDGMLLVVNNIEQRTAKDAVFEVFKANANLLVGGKSSYLNHMYLAITKGSRFDDIYWGLFTFFVEERLFKDAVLVLGILEDISGYSFARNHFSDDPDYHAFLESDEFKKWIRSR